MAIKIEGLKDLDKALSELKTYTARRVGKRAMAKALEPVAVSARQRAPRSKDGKHLADSIGVGQKLTKAQAKEQRRAQREGRHIMLMYVGPREPHSHLVEFGTVERFHKSGKSVGKMPPSPFMRPAWDENSQAVLKTLSVELRAELDRAIARAAKAAGKGGSGGAVRRPVGKRGWSG